MSAFQKYAPAIERCRAISDRFNPGYIVVRLFAPSSENIIWGLLLRAARKGVLRGRAFLLFLFLAFLYVIYEPARGPVSMCMAGMIALQYGVMISFPTNMVRTLKSTNRSSDFLSLPLRSQTYIQAYVRWFVVATTLFVIGVAVMLALALAVFSSSVQVADIIAVLSKPAPMIAATILSFFWLSYWAYVARGWLVLIGYVYVLAELVYLLSLANDERRPVLLEYVWMWHWTLAALMTLSGTGLYLYCRRTYLDRLRRLLFP